MKTSNNADVAADDDAVETFFKQQQQQEIAQVVPTVSSNDLLTNNESRSELKDDVERDLVTGEIVAKTNNTKVNSIHSLLVLLTKKSCLKKSSVRPKSPQTTSPCSSSPNLQSGIVIYSHNIFIFCIYH